MKNKFLILIFIVILGACLRLFNISVLPPALNWDEVSHGYNAYSILKTGKDQWGQLLPALNFRAYGDYPLPLNLYLTIPFVAALGLNEFSIRLPHALLGIGTIIATYFMVKGLIKKENIALLSSLLVSVDPWTLFTSRFVLQSNLSVFLLTTSAALFFNREKRKIFLPLSILALGLTLYSYHTTRIVSPLILFAAIIIYWKEIRLSWVSTALIAAFLIPLPFIFLNPAARARSNVVFILNEGAVANIIAKRQSSKMPQLVSRIIYNRPTYFIWHFGNNYLDYFFPKFLFFSGGTQYQFSVPNYGLMGIASLPFFYISLVWLIIKSRTVKEYRLILAWFLIAPIPASITVDKFAVLRATSMLPLPELLSAIGFFVVLNHLKFEKLKWVFVTIYLACLAYGLEKYMTNYVIDYPKNYSWSWQYGYKEAVSYAKENYEKYDKIIVTKKYGEPHEYFLFYNAWDPQKYQSDPNAIRFFQSNWYWVDRFDKFYFVNDWQVRDMKLESGSQIDCKNQKCLLITSFENYPEGWSKIKDINFLDGKSAFEIYEN
ncbi:MAG: glycosyltransferase family 39 protein [Patescibacteria group bacterium]